VDHKFLTYSASLFMQLFAYIVTIAFAFDSFFKFKNFRERMSQQQQATSAGDPEAGAAAGMPGAADKAGNPPQY
jgi:hypothetical protein